MSRFGITYDRKHSYRDIGLTVASKKIGNPKKIKRKQRVPHSNKIYDFSSVYGGQEYEERLITLVFNVADYNKVNLAIEKIQALNWLMQSNEKIRLEDDYIPGYYFLAEVEEAPDFDELKYHGTLTVTFTAYPFKISILEEGHDIWDVTNFLLDIFQITQYNVTGRRDITLYNNGASNVHPVIRATAPMQFVTSTANYNVPIGESSSLDFFIPQGVIDFTIVGNGEVSFHWHKELI
ncbi:phage tail domain-containing protein [Alkalihalobacillus trypoxylicola]|uniref:Phage tail protein n=1 Tax=Alkalihalobacillus trypoxylicola TaxID=519424 RepID=A0A161PHB7_9BACI|nr:phage tail domain-containing protein [Alkalihalobacillus trypoxylicola]KYG28183.1 hypothetical protein AZF04_09785 [Alkalihalobacillus trypoxylicola]